MNLKNQINKSIEEHNNFIDMVIKNKYCHEGESCWEDIVDRLGKVLDLTYDEKECILNKRFIPGGSILSGAGKDNISMSNCYGIPIKSSNNEPCDSIDAIFDTQKNIANVSKARGGCGFILTALRPKNEKVNNAAKTSTGAVSFLPSFSEVGKVVGQGHRRSALISLLDIRHPDTLDFIWCKSKPEKVFQKDIFTEHYPDISSINISLIIPDEFYNVVENDEDWIFKFPDIEYDKEKYNKYWHGDYEDWEKNNGELKEYGRINARELLKEISESAWYSGDPGQYLITNAQENCYSTYIDDKIKPRLTNPCGR